MDLTLGDGELGYCSLNPAKDSPVYWKPSELTLVPLSAVEPGSLFELPDFVDQFPLFLRLANIEGKSGVMALGGESSLEVFPWDPPSDARIVCAPDRLLVKLNGGTDVPQMDEPGTITLHRGGAFLQSKAGRRQARGVKISTSTWEPVRVNDLQGEISCFAKWQFGQLDGSGTFLPIFPK
jgi:hypothetical protein